MKIEISIITSMYNKEDSTIEVLDKLFFPSLINNASKDTEVIILDDASPMKKETKTLIERYIPTLRKKFGRITFKRNPFNLGFAGSFNKGINIAKGKILFIVNDDIYLPKNTVKALTNTIYEDKNFGLVGPIVNEKDCLSYQYCKQAPKMSSYSKEDIAKIENFSSLAKKIMKGRRIEVDFISGFCVVAFSSLVKKVGGFDSSFLNGGHEDADLSMEIKKQYKIIVNPEIFVSHGGIHGGHVSLNQNRLKRHYYEVRNFILLAKKRGYLPAMIHLLNIIIRELGFDTVSNLFEKELSKPSN
jgi:GT2 family glycosyltransferase